MEAVSYCPICGATDCGDCRRAVVAYFKTLDGVHQRVLREKAASVVPHLPVLGAGIDKLEVAFAEPLKASEVISRAKHLGYPCQPTKLPGLGLILRVKTDSACIDFRTGFNYEYLKGFVSNPNTFGSWPQYMNTVSSLLSSQAIETARIKRLDLNLDFSCSLSNLIQSIDIRNKRLSHLHSDESGKRSGLQIGKGNETLVIYDKGLKEGTERLHSRLEVHHRQRKVGARKLNDVGTAMLRDNLLAGIEGLTVTIPERVCTQVRDFRTILLREGFYPARKAANLNRNFERDISSRIQIAKWSVQPSELFREAIQRFMRGTEFQARGLKLV